MGLSQILIFALRLRRAANFRLRGTIFCLKTQNICLKSYDHEICHVRPLSDLELHGPSGIFIIGCVAPQGGAAFSSSLSVKKLIFCLKSHDHEIWHVGSLSDLE